MPSRISGTAERGEVGITHRIDTPRPVEQRVARELVHHEQHDVRLRGRLLDRRAGQRALGLRLVRGTREAEHEAHRDDDDGDHDAGHDRGL
jgi:hypothetical protein